MVQQSQRFTAKRSRSLWLSNAFVITGELKWSKEKGTLITRHSKANSFLKLVSIVCNVLQTNTDFTYLNSIFTLCSPLKNEWNKNFTTN